MINNAKYVFGQNTAQLTSSLDKLMSVPDSKNLTKEEEKEVSASLVSFAHTLKKTSKNGFVSPELKEIVNNFQMAGYDIAKMPKEYANSLKRTYEDINEVIKTNPGAYKDKASKAYCDAYELFSGVKFKNFANNLKNSKGVKKILHSKESVNPDCSFEAYERYLGTLDDNVQSQELFGSVTASFTSLTGSVSVLSSILIVAVVIIAILIICMCIISAMYQQKVVEAIEELAKNANKPSYPKKINKAAVVASMEDNIPKATNTFLVKPMTLCTKFINKLTEPKVSKQLKDGADSIEKSNSKESYDQSQEVGMISTGIAMVAGFAASHPIVIFVGIICALVLIVPLIRGLIYWMSRFRFKIGSLLKAQNETISDNIEVLINKMNDPSTSPEEKARLQRVISRQEGMAKNIKKLSDLFYKEQLNANGDANYNLNEDEKIDYDKIVEEKQKQEEENTFPIVNPTEPINVGSNSIVL